MSYVIINDVIIQNPKADFMEPISLEIQGQCYQQPKEDFELKITYIGKAEDSDFN